MQKSLQVLLVVVTLLLGCIAMGLFSRSALSQSPVVPLSSVGRYQLTLFMNAEYLLDTQTGQVWSRTNNATDPWRPDPPLPSAKPR